MLLRQQEAERRQQDEAVKQKHQDEICQLDEEAKTELLSEKQRSVAGVKIVEATDDEYDCYSDSLFLHVTEEEQGGVSNDTVEQLLQCGWAPDSTTTTASELMSPQLS